MRWLVLLVAVVGCSKAEITSNRDSGSSESAPAAKPKDNPPPIPADKKDKTSPPKEDLASVIRSAKDLVGCADGEEITICGKVGRGGNGMTDAGDVADDLAGRPTSPNTTPLFAITFPDGGRITCAFAATPRDAYTEWLKKNKPGTVVTVRGVYWNLQGHLITRCKVLPDGFK